MGAPLSQRYLSTTFSPERTWDLELSAGKRAG